MKKKTTVEFVTESQAIHKDRYSYGSCTYQGNLIPVTITCGVHGDYQVVPKNHLLGSGCKKCTGVHRRSNEEFIDACKSVHGDFYDYTKTVFVKNNKPVIITCPIHKDFQQIAEYHLSGRGCKLCGHSSIDQDEFITQAIAVHGSKYDYTNVVYVNKHHKVAIKCTKHGDFLQAPSNHLAGKGCSSCNSGVSFNKETFIKNSLNVHGSRYDYSKVVYKDANTPVTIICQVHGEFIQKPVVHYNLKAGCQLCKGGVVSNTDTFTAKSNIVHQNEFLYDKVVYVNQSTAVEIGCKKCDQYFWQVPKKHLAGGKCNLCHSGGFKGSFAKFRTNSTTVHGDRYDYSEAIYVNAATALKIICSDHGPFWSTPNNHISAGTGCPECGKIESGANRRRSQEEMLTLLKTKQPNTITYDKFVFNGYSDNITLTCTIHGDFEKSYYNALVGQTCMICSKTKYARSSRGEEQLLNQIDQPGMIRNSRKIIPPLELDAYFPDRQLAIEYCGLYWHSTARGKDKNYHRNKLEMCTKHGIRLITVFEDEWNKSSDLVITKIGAALNRSTIIPDHDNIQIDLRWDHLPDWIDAGYRVVSYHEPQAWYVYRHGRLSDCEFNKPVIYDCGSVSLTQDRNRSTGDQAQLKF